MSPLALNRGLNALLVTLGVALALGLGLRATGHTALVDYTDSMQPAIAAGDVVVDESTTAADLRPGQIASIHDPATDRLITHRVVSVTPETSGRVAIVTRGDANESSERWVLAAGEPVKRMVTRVPWVGHVMVWLASPALRSALLLIAAAGFLLFGLRRLVRPA